MKSKGRELLELLGKIKNDFSFGSTKIGGFPVGELSIDQNGDFGEVEVELPLDNIDPDSTTLIVPLSFTYKISDGISVSIEPNVRQYSTSDNGILKDLNIEDMKKAIDLINNNVKMEKDLANIIDKVIKKHYKD
jgi:hypothetical protein